MRYLLTKTSIVFALFFIHSQIVTGMVDSCGTQYYAKSVSKLFYGSKRSPTIMYSKTIVSNSVDCGGTRFITYIDCLRGSKECEPLDTMVIYSNGDAYHASSSENRRDFMFNVCWPIGTVYRNLSVITRYENNAILFLFGQPFTVKVYRQYYTVNNDTTELRSTLLNDSLGEVGEYDSDHGDIDDLVVGAIIDGVPFGITTSVADDQLTEASSSLHFVVKDILLLPEWVRSLVSGNLMIYDSQGRELLRQAVTEPSLDVSWLTPGAYFIRVLDINSHRSRVFSIIVI